MKGGALIRGRASSRLLPFGRDRTLLLMGETRVDLLRLLEDLRDAYPGSIEETIVTETVANSLDSGARDIAVSTDPLAGTFTVVDNGKGMGRAALTRYHDLAVTSKKRGRGIGFAGVGIKLGLLISDDVITETRSSQARKSLSTSWRFTSRKRAPWRWVEPPGLLRESGTAVRLYLSNSLSRLLDSGFLETTLLHHFQPLFHPEIVEGVLEPHYPDGVLFRVNGRPLAQAARDPEGARIEIKVGRQKKASGIGFIARAAVLDEDERGIAVSTLGKVIMRGWDWIGFSSSEADSVTGLVEIPPLAEVLTLNKADFIRTGRRGATYLAYRKAMQEAVSMQLESWGSAADARPEPRRRTRTLERDLRSVLADLSDEYPLLAALVERRPGGQRRLPLGDAVSARGHTPGSGPDLRIPVAEEQSSGSGRNGGDKGSGGADVAGTDPNFNPSADLEASTASPGQRRDGALPGRPSTRKPARYGLRVRFESRPGDPGLGRLVESTAWVNDAHPAHGRAVASRSEGYHVALSVAMALAEHTVEPADVRDFVSNFLGRWGQVGG